MKQRKIFVFLSVLILFLGFQQLLVAENTPEEAKNIKVLTQIVKQAYGQGNFDGLDKFYTSTCKQSLNGVLGEGVGAEAAINSIKATLDQYPNLKIKIDNIFAKDNMVTMLWTVEGKHNELGKDVKVSGVYVGRYVDGKLAEGWQTYDILTIYQQLGYKITPPEPPKKK